MTDTLSSIANQLAGKFIVLDGGDGCGKTTQLDLLAKAMESADLTVCRLRDPGSTATGDQIRQILLSHETGDLCPACEMLLFMASRAQMLAEKIRPALAAGHVVLCDRFVSSTLAYQGASGVDVGNVTKIWELSGGHWPDLTLVLTLPPEVALERARSNSSQGGDRMEQRPGDYHAKVAQGFADLPNHYPAPVRIVSADGGIDDVSDAIRQALYEVFG